MTKEVLKSTVLSDQIDALDDPFLPSKDGIADFIDWTDVYRNLDSLKEELTLEIIGHIDMLEEGKYYGPRLSQNAIRQLLKERQEEIEAIRQVDPTDKEAVKRLVIQYIKLKNQMADEAQHKAA